MIRNMTDALGTKQQAVLADVNYRETLKRIGAEMLAWDGPVYIASHVDPDGDALGSVLTAKRALAKLGKETIAVVSPPPYLAFLAAPGELTAPVETLPENALLLVVDTALDNRVDGVDYTQAARTFNIDHHGTNPRTGDLSVVEPSKGANAILMKQFVEELGVEWDANLAEPCLAGILTDTGFMRFGNTNAEVLHSVASLLEHGVDYANLTDQLQLRHPNYFKLLGMVMDTVRFDFDGKMVSVVLREEDRVRAQADESNDFVGVIRYAEGSYIAVMMREKDDAVKLSVRTRAPLSAQRVCVALGGGGHVAAAGATVPGDIESVREKLLAEVEAEIARAFA